jgi:hypothetical protein
LIPFHFTPHHFTITAKQRYMPWPSNFLQREKIAASLKQLVIMAVATLLRQSFALWLKQTYSRVRSYDRRREKE